MKLFKIIIDYQDPDTHDGSEDRKHTELIYDGDEAGLRAKMVELKIITPLVSKNPSIGILHYFASNKGYILRGGGN